MREIILADTFNNNLTISGFAWIAAIWIGDQPRGCLIFGSAPLMSKRCTFRASPFFVYMNKGSEWNEMFSNQELLPTWFVWYLKPFTISVCRFIIFIFLLGHTVGYNNAESSYRKMIVRPRILVRIIISSNVDTKIIPKLSWA